MDGGGSRMPELFREEEKRRRTCQQICGNTYPGGGSSHEASLDRTVRRGVKEGERGEKVGKSSVCLILHIRVDLILSSEQVQ